MKIMESLRRASFVKVWHFSGRSIYFSFLTGYSKSEESFGFTFKIINNIYKNRKSRGFKFAFYLIFFDIIFSYYGKYKEIKK